MSANEPQVRAVTPNNSRENEITRRGSAIAEVRHLTERYEKQIIEIEEIKRELQIANDRMAILAEERAKWRADAEIYRVALIELASDMANIGLLTNRAQETHGRVMHLINAPIDEKEKQIEDKKNEEQP